MRGVVDWATVEDQPALALTGLGGHIGRVAPAGAQDRAGRRIVDCKCDGHFLNRPTISDRFLIRASLTQPAGGEEAVTARTMIR